MPDMDTNPQDDEHGGVEWAVRYMSAALADFERKAANPKWPKRKMPPGPRLQRDSRLVVIEAEAITLAVEEWRAARAEVERARLRVGGLARELWMAGATVTQISEAAGVGDTTIRSMANAHYADEVRRRDVRRSR